MSTIAQWAQGYEVDVFGHGRLQPGDSTEIPDGEANESANWFAGMDGGGVDEPDGIADGGTP